MMYVYVKYVHIHVCTYVLCTCQDICHTFEVLSGHTKDFAYAAFSVHAI